MIKTNNGEHKCSLKTKDTLPLSAVTGKIL